MIRRNTENKAEKRVDIIRRGEKNGEDQSMDWEKGEKQKRQTVQNVTTFYGKQYKKIHFGCFICIFSAAEAAVPREVRLPSPGKAARTAAFPAYRCRYKERK